MPDEIHAEAVEAPQGDVAADAVADRLRERISRGELPPGTPLRDAALAGELGVSRNTLREAVRLLVHEGLAVHQLYKGAAVKRLDVADVHDIYAARRCVELRAVEESVYSPTEALENLDRRVTEAERAAAAERWNEAGTFSLGFHRAVVHLLGSARLDRFFDTTAAQLRLAFAEFPQEQDFQAQYVPRDRVVCDLLRSGGRAEAATALRQYLDDSERQVVDMVRAAAAARQN
ncbi:GntR family transcriptional regulator [Streptomyces cavernicola]|uniref:GntR family transcriptional regulator n=1 Tax=Streptomyces cavernicola TaxID=3043613 RepID=A0ABT6SAQ2_9ACTN|nr:GntR family transcriptional regulator [Streptomyces sp. B-S-A6]MDI3404752.1 GntR family transcriptional regulator [Streptomyces sp. B-S-A6]